MVYKRLAASERFVLGSVSEKNIGSWVVHVVIVAGSVSIAVKGRAAGSARSEAPVAITSADDQALHYKLGSTAAVTAGATPITAEGIYIIPADGVDVILDATVTTGPTDLYCVPLHG
jgi:hypothetical protein